MKKGKQMSMYVIMSMMMFTACSGESEVKEPVQNEPITEEVNNLLVLDALAYAPTSDGILSEADIIALHGEPTSVEDWNHPTNGGSYAIRTLSYPNGLEFKLHKDQLHRVSIMDVPFESSDDFLKMFGMENEKYTTTVNNAGTFRIKTTQSVKELHVVYGGNMIGIAHISYSDLFTG